MIIKSLELVNFRNYQHFKIKFKPVTVLYGPNGIGKTNIIESLGMLSYAKSFRAHDERNLILTLKKYAQIKAKLFDDTDINFVLSQDSKNLKKEVKIKGVKQNITKLIGILKVVLFSPESLKIITGSPYDRRKFIDILISQLDKRYLENLIRFKHILKQKNKLLKIIAFSNTDSKGLVFWNKELIKCSKYIIKKRQEVSKMLEKNIQEKYNQITSKKNDKIKLVYTPKINNLDKIEELIDLAKEREIEAQKTIYGPHLDDIKFLINSKPIADVGSRGEIRSVIFCLKLAEIDYLENTNKEKKEKILLLLDDIFSELDIKRRKKILNLIKDRQTIISVTEKELLDLNLKNINFINLETYAKNRQDN